MGAVSAAVWAYKSMHYAEEAVRILLAQGYPPTNSQSSTRTCRVTQATQGSHEVLVPDS
ncbi:hypothetical protein GCM10009760_54680 [Kitasatospora kazusensis]|uniref:Uncharacterized protein n=1 Tax=Kitasatospora kazusensis TaxID=407974 RepID=A0ABP5LWG8_9ACTN